MHQRVPQEILDMIIGSLSIYDRDNFAALKACALASRCLLPASRKMRFSTLHFGTSELLSSSPCRAAEKFRQLLESSPHISSYVRSVRLILAPSGDPSLDFVLRKLPKLDSLRLLLDQGGRAVSQEFLEALKYLCATSPIRSMELIWSAHKQIPLSIIPRNLHTLKLESSAFPLEKPEQFLHIMRSVKHLVFTHNLHFSEDPLQHLILHPGPNSVRHLSVHIESSVGLRQVMESLPDSFPRLEHLSLVFHSSSPTSLDGFAGLDKFSRLRVFDVALTASYTTVPGLATSVLGIIDILSPLLTTKCLAVEEIYIPFEVIIRDKESAGDGLREIKSVGGPLDDLLASRLELFPKLQFICVCFGLLPLPGINVDRKDIVFGYPKLESKGLFKSGIGFVPI